VKQALLDNIKNIPGWKSARKILVLSVDDYGNVRLDSQKARKAMNEAGLKVLSRFDAYDTLESRRDLEMLYEVLDSVRDSKERAAVFTPFAMPANINFEAMAEQDYQSYIPENLPETYRKLEALQPKAYQGAWDLWQEGIEKALMVPQFHGREHLNLKSFEAKLAARDTEVLMALKNRSYTSISKSGFPNISYTAAYEFEELEENQSFKFILQDGLDRFEEVYGYKSVHFNPPGGREHPMIHPFLKEKGVKYLDTPFIKRQHEGGGRYQKSLNWTGKQNKEGLILQVRNVVFEPTDNRGFDWVDYSFRQIATAFKWNKPAIVSSHRVNFCGEIDPENRRKGLAALKALLERVVKHYPDVEFMSSVELGDTIAQSLKP